MANRDMLAGPLRRLHPEFGTPAPAILVVGAVSILAALLGETILEPISEVGSFTCALGWLATCSAYCCGAAGKLTPMGWAMGLLGVVMAGSFVVIVAAGFGYWEWFVTSGWAACGLALWLARRSDPLTRTP
jgi:hypothetical protein